MLLPIEDQRALQQLAHETDLSLAYFLLRCVRQLLMWWTVPAPGNELP
jgi:hypothetical protein